MGANEQFTEDMTGLFNGTPDDRLLMAEAVLGRDVEDFCRSDIGRYLIGRANQEIEVATMQLKRVLPWRRRKIQDLQNQIWRGEQLKEWLLEQIQAGKTAVSELDRRTQTGED